MSFLSPLGMLAAAHSQGFHRPPPDSIPVDIETETDEEGEGEGEGDDDGDGSEGVRESFFRALYLAPSPISPIEILEDYHVTEPLRIHKRSDEVLTSEGSRFASAVPELVLTAGVANLGRRSTLLSMPRSPSPTSPHAMMFPLPPTEFPVYPPQPPPEQTQELAETPPAGRHLVTPYARRSLPPTPTPARTAPHRTIPRQLVDVPESPESATSITRLIPGVHPGPSQENPQEETFELELHFSDDDSVSGKTPAPLSSPAVHSRKAAAVLGETIIRHVPRKAAAILGTDHSETSPKALKWRERFSPKKKRHGIAAVNGPAPTLRSHPSALGLTDAPDVFGPPLTINPAHASDFGWLADDVSVVPIAQLDVPRVDTRVRIEPGNRAADASMVPFDSTLSLPLLAQRCESPSSLHCPIPPRPPALQRGLSPSAEPVGSASVSVRSERSDVLASYPPTSFRMQGLPTPPSSSLKNSRDIAAHSPPPDIEAMRFTPPPPLFPVLRPSPSQTSLRGGVQYSSLGIGAKSMQARNQKTPPQSDTDSPGRLRTSGEDERGASPSARKRPPPLTLVPASPARRHFPIVTDTSIPALEPNKRGGKGFGLGFGLGGVLGGGSGGGGASGGMNVNASANGNVVPAAIRSAGAEADGSSPGTPFMNPRMAPKPLGPRHRGPVTPPPSAQGHRKAHSRSHSRGVNLSGVANVAGPALRRVRSIGRDMSAAASASAPTPGPGPVPNHGSGASLGQAAGRTATGTTTDQPDRATPRSGKKQALARAMTPEVCARENISWFEPDSPTTVYSFNPSGAREWLRRVAKPPLV